MQAPGSNRDCYQAEYLGYSWLSNSDEKKIKRAFKKEKNKKSDVLPTKKASFETRGIIRKS
jgi:hypothetical protein